MFFQIGLFLFIGVVCMILGSYFGVWLANRTWKKHLVEEGMARWILWGNNGETHFILNTNKLEELYKLRRFMITFGIHHNISSDGTINYDLPNQLIDNITELCSKFYISGTDFGSRETAKDKFPTTK